MWTPARSSRAASRCSTLCKPPSRGNGRGRPGCKGQPPTGSAGGQQRPNPLSYVLVAPLIAAFGVEFQRAQGDVALVAQDTLPVKRNGRPRLSIMLRKPRLPIVGGRPEIEP